MAKYKLIIEADTNDADYVSTINEITKDDLEKLYPVFDAIKNFKPYNGKSVDKDCQFDHERTHNHNWPYGDEEYIPRIDLGEKTVEEIYADVLTPDQIELFTDLCPFGEYGIHTITSIKVLEYIQEKEYL